MQLGPFLLIVAVAHVRSWAGSFGMGASALLPCMFLTLLPAQIFPETVNATFVSRALPKPAVVVTPAEASEKRHAHSRRVRQQRP